MLNKTVVCLAGATLASSMILVLSQTYLTMVDVLVLPVCAVVLCCFFLSGAKIEWVLMVLIFNVMIGSVRGFESSFLNINRLIGITIVLVLLFEVLVLKHRRVIFTSQSMWVLVFGLVVLCSVFFSENVDTSLERLRLYLRILALYFLVTNIIISRLWFNRVWRLLMLAGIMLTLYSMVDSWSFKTYGLPITDRLGITISSRHMLEWMFRVRDPNRLYGALGSTYDVNYFALILVSLLPLSVAFLNDKKPWLRTFSYVSGIVILGGILLSLSRAAIVALAVAGSLLIKRSLIEKKVLGVVFVVVLVTIATMIPMKSLKRLYNIVLYPFNIRSVQTLDVDIDNALHRVELISTGFRIFLDHPVMGIGIGNFPEMYVKYTRVAPKRQHYMAHNTYLQILTETGLVGFVVFAYVIFSSFRVLRRTRKVAIGGGDEEFYKKACLLEIGLISFLIAGFFVSASHMDIFWILVALTTCLSSTISNEKSSLRSEGSVC